MANTIKDLIARWGGEPLAIKPVAGPGEAYDQAFRYLYQQVVERGYRPSFEALEKHIEGVMASGIIFLIGREQGGEVLPIGAVAITLDAWGEWYGEKWPQTAALVQDLYIEPEHRSPRTIISVIDGLIGITKQMGADAVVWEEIKEHAFFARYFEQASYFILRHDDGKEEVVSAATESGRVRASAESASSA